MLVKSYMTTVVTSACVIASLATHGESSSASSYRKPLGGLAFIVLDPWRVVCSGGCTVYSQTAATSFSSALSAHAMMRSTRRRYGSDAGVSVRDGPTWSR
jgi:hypothetical protein